MADDSVPGAGGAERHVPLVGENPDMPAAMPNVPMPPQPPFAGAGNQNFDVTDGEDTVPAPPPPLPPRVTPPQVARRPGRGDTGVRGAEGGRADDDVVEESQRAAKIHAKALLTHDPTRPGILKRPRGAPSLSQAAFRGTHSKTAPAVAQRGRSLGRGDSRTGTSRPGTPEDDAVPASRKRPQVQSEHESESTRATRQSGAKPKDYGLPKRI